jgi:predicted enzyme related to lactoylglutathione lyase
VIKGLKFIRVPTINQARAVAFWTQKMGLTVASEQPFDDSQRWVELRVPGADTRLVLFTPTSGETPVGVATNVAFTTPDVERAYADLRAKGVEFVSPVRKFDWGATAAFKDSEGNTFLLASP